MFACDHSGRFCVFQRLFESEGFPLLICTMPLAVQACFLVPSLKRGKTTLFYTDAMNPLGKNFPKIGIDGS